MMELNDFAALLLQQQIIATLEQIGEDTVLKTVDINTGAEQWWDLCKMPLDGSAVERVSNYWVRHRHNIITAKNISI